MRGGNRLRRMQIIGGVLMYTAPTAGSASNSSIEVTDVAMPRSVA